MCELKQNFGTFQSLKMIFQNKLTTYSSRHDDRRISKNYLKIGGNRIYHINHMSSKPWENV